MSVSIMDLYLKEISSFPLLSADEEKELARRIQNGDEEALRRLAEANLRFVVKVAKKYQCSGLSLLDLIHEGNLGLLEAASRFDPDKNVKFITYAVWWIRHHFQTAIQSLSGPLRLSAAARNALKTVRSMDQQDRNQTISFEEMVEASGMSRKGVGLALCAGGPAVTLNGFAGDFSVQMLGNHTHSSYPSPEDAVELKCDVAYLAAALQDLPPMEQRVLSLRFGLNGDKPCTLRDIGGKMGLSRERIRQIECKALERLRRRWKGDCAAVPVRNKVSRNVSLDSGRLKGREKMQEQEAIPA